MPLPKEHIYTSEDYWNLPAGQRAELIDGHFYNMAPPSRIHQKLISELQLYHQAAVKWIIQPKMLFIQMPVSVNTGL